MRWFLSLFDLPSKLFSDWLVEPPVLTNEVPFASGGSGFWLETHFLILHLIFPIYFIWLVKLKDFGSLKLKIKLKLWMESNKLLFP